jgi:FkbM family methyltransferase
MPRLSTRQKVTIARLLNRTVRLGRSILRKPMQGEFTRNGLRWNLDLNEGIDLAIYLLGAFERDLVRCYEKLINPGDTVLDIGANIGAHTLPLARAVGPTGRVIAIEATAYAIEKLRTNFALNPELESRINLKHALLVSSGERVNAETEITSSWPVDGRASDNGPLCGAQMAIGSAQCITLDQLLIDNGINNISWIKLDVDGHEYGILQGAADCLRRIRPAIFMELAPYCYAASPASFDNLLECLRSADYTFYRLSNFQPLPSSTESVLKKIPKNGSINVLCRPRLS